MKTNLDVSDFKTWYAVVVTSMDTDCECHRCLFYETHQDIDETRAILRWQEMSDAFRFSMTRVTLIKNGKDILRVNHPFPQEQAESLQTPTLPLAGQLDD